MMYNEDNFKMVQVLRKTAVQVLWRRIFYLQ